MVDNIDDSNWHKKIFKRENVKKVLIEGYSQDHISNNKINEKDKEREIKLTNKVQIKEVSQNFKEKNENTDNIEATLECNKVDKNDSDDDKSIEQAIYLLRSCSNPPHNKIIDDIYKGDIDNEDDNLNSFSDNISSLLDNYPNKRVTNMLIRKLLHNHLNENDNGSNKKSKLLSIAISNEKKVVKEVSKVNEIKESKENNIETKTDIKGENKTTLNENIIYKEIKDIKDMKEASINTDKPNYNYIDVDFFDVLGSEGM